VSQCRKQENARNLQKMLRSGASPQLSRHKKSRPRKRGDGFFYVLLEQD
jgi:hypothetical protein